MNQFQGMNNQANRGPIYHNPPNAPSGTANGALPMVAGHYPYPPQPMLQPYGMPMVYPGGIPMGGMQPGYLPGQQPYMGMPYPGMHAGFQPGFQTMPPTYMAPHHHLGMAPTAPPPPAANKPNKPFQTMLTSLATASHANKTTVAPAAPNWFCESCDKEFTAFTAYQAHIAQHEKCQHEGCSFTASKRVVQAHFLSTHGTYSGSGYKMIDVEGQQFRVLMGSSPDEIAQWRADRRKKFPSAAAVAEKADQEQKLLDAGGLLPLPGGGKDNFQQAKNYKAALQSQRKNKGQENKDKQQSATAKTIQSKRDLNQVMQDMIFKNPLGAAKQRQQQPTSGVMIASTSTAAESPRFADPDSLPECSRPVTAADLLPKPVAPASKPTGFATFTTLSVLDPAAPNDGESANKRARMETTAEEEGQQQGDENEMNEDGDGEQAGAPAAGPTGFSLESKMKKCHQYGRGKCRLGSTCNFSHDFIPQTCEWFVRGNCRRGFKCFNVHDFDAMKARKREIFEKRKQRHQQRLAQQEGDGEGEGDGESGEQKSAGVSGADASGMEVAGGPADGAAIDSELSKYGPGDKRKAWAVASSPSSNHHHNKRGIVSAAGVPLIPAPMVPVPNTSPAVPVPASSLSAYQRQHGLNARGELSIPEPVSNNELLKRLLADEIHREESLALQCLRYLVQSNFLQIPPAAATVTTAPTSSSADTPAMQQSDMGSADSNPLVQGGSGAIGTEVEPAAVADQPNDTPDTTDRNMDETA